MSPQRSKGTYPPPRSRRFWNSITSSQGEPPPQDGQFAESGRSSAADSNREQPLEGIGTQPTAPFPPGLFRLPVPDRLFWKMPEMSDAALRSLLALVHLSWHFDPADGTWVHSEDAFLRAEVEAAAGLSDEGTRQGLSELAEMGWVVAEASGRSHRHQLQLSVPTRRFTYLPTALLTSTGQPSSGTALRVLLAVFRETWGWTQKDPSRKERSSKEGTSPMLHRRWAALSHSALSEATGRSQTAVKEAANALEDAWLSRVRPHQSAYHYRVLPEAFAPKAKAVGTEKETSGDAPSPSPTANEVPPERQRSVPPSFSKENPLRDKHNAESSQNQKSNPGPRQPDKPERDAVPEETSPSAPRPDSSCMSQEGKSNSSPGSNGGELTPKQEALAQKLINVGVWPERARECLRHYSLGRIEANFELYRKRAPEIQNSGAWLCAAITDGYAGFKSGRDESNPSRGQDSSQKSPDPPSQALEHKQKVSPENKRRLLRQRDDLEEDHFHRFRHAESPTQKQFLYFDPEKGGPERQRDPARGADSVIA